MLVGSAVAAEMFVVASLLLSFGKRASGTVRALLTETDHRKIHRIVVIVGGKVVRGVGLLRSRGSSIARRGISGAVLRDCAVSGV